jgi:hypothetical protein
MAPQRLVDLGGDVGEKITPASHLLEQRASPGRLPRITKAALQLHDHLYLLLLIEAALLEDASPESPEL